MSKERLFGIDDGYSEKEADLALDKQKSNDQVKAGSIFVNPKKSKKKPSI